MALEADNNSGIGEPLSAGGFDGGLERRPELKTLGAGRYQIIKRAGRGGWSLVYHAHDLEQQREVAIKVLSMELSFEESFLERFQRESDLMHDLNHPHILQAYDYGQEAGLVYLVMSYYGGGTIRDRLRQGRLSLKEAAAYLSQIAEGLGYAHSRNIIHRDIKPSNVLIHHLDGHLALSDFGIAKALSSANPSHTGTIMGTPLYMAPEQFLDRVDRRSDIYSLGVMLYQMLCGDVPFRGEGIGFKHLNDPVPSLRTQGIPPGVERVVLKALAKRPETRFQTVEELAVAFDEAVRQFTSGETMEAFLPFGAGGSTPSAKNLQSTVEIAALTGEQTRLSAMQIIHTGPPTPSRPIPKAPLRREEASKIGNDEELEATTPLVGLPKRQPSAAINLPSEPLSGAKPSVSGSNNYRVSAPVSLENSESEPFTPSSKPVYTRLSQNTGSPGQSKNLMKPKSSREQISRQLFPIFFAGSMLLLTIILLAILLFTR